MRTPHAIAFATLLFVAGFEFTPAPVHAAPIFRISTGDFWLNLHQFLYVLGRAEAKTPDRARRAVAGAPADQAKGLSALTADEQSVWREAVTSYAKGPSTLDAVFDDALIKAEGTLAAAGSAVSLNGRNLDPAMRAILERAASLYRTTWWPQHQSANAAWTTSTEALIAQHGAAVLKRITTAYGMTWPADGYPVHISAYSNWAGAFSTRGDLLIVSSLDPEISGPGALETIFHEGMHQWDQKMLAVLTDVARKQGKTNVPDGLSHAMVFYTSGDAVRREVPGHVMNADTLGIWGRSPAGLKPALDAAWLPYLDGKGTRDEAIAAVIRLLAERTGNQSRG